MQAWDAELTELYRTATDAAGSGGGRMEARMSEAPTKTGAWAGVDRGTGTPWAFESAQEHWRLHDQRERAYWRSRPAGERLAQASLYRVRVHGLVTMPTHWPWRFVPFGE